MNRVPEGGPRADYPPLLGSLLRMPHQAMIAEYVLPGLAATGHGELRPIHFPVTQTLSMYPQGLWATDLAARSRVTKQTMGEVIDHLESLGYVERVPDPADGRARLIRLTQRGWDFVATVRAFVRQAEQEWAEMIGADRVEQLRGLLVELGTAINSRAPAAAPASGPPRSMLHETSV